MKHSLISFRSFFFTLSSLHGSHRSFMRKYHKDQKYNALERRVLRKDQKGEHLDNHMLSRHTFYFRSRLEDPLSAVQNHIFRADHITLMPGRAKTEKEKHRLFVETRNNAQSTMIRSSSVTVSLSGFCAITKTSRYTVTLNSLYFHLQSHRYLCDCDWFKLIWMEKPQKSFRRRTRFGCLTECVNTVSLLADKHTLKKASNTTTANLHH